MTRLPELSPEKIYQTVDQKRRTEKMSWRKVALAAGLPVPSGCRTLSRLAFGRLPDVFNLTLILMWADETDLRVFLKDQA